MCKYGKECYQKNPMHHQKFKHPTSDNSESKDLNKRPLITDDDEVGETSSPLKMAKSETDGVGKENSSPAKTADTKGYSNVEKAVQPFLSSKRYHFLDSSTDDISDEDGVCLPPQGDWPKDSILNLEQKFLVKMPPDFFAFWDFCLLSNRSNPREALLETTGLRLVGPFDLLPESKVF